MLIADIMFLLREKHPRQVLADSMAMTTASAEARIFSPFSRECSTDMSHLPLTPQLRHDFFGKKVAWRPLGLGATRKNHFQSAYLRQTLRLAKQGEVGRHRASCQRCYCKTCFHHAEQPHQAGTFK